MQLTNEPIKVHESWLYNYAAYDLDCDLSQLKLGSIVSLSLASKEHIQAMVALISPHYMLGQVITFGASIAVGDIVKFHAGNVIL